MEQSILRSTKKGLHISPDDNSFDLDVVTQINSAFSTLNDIGVGPAIGFVVEDDTPTWNDFLPGTEHKVQQNQVKTFVLLTVRLAFDPPSAAYLLDAMQRQLAEVTSRISMRRESVEWAAPIPPGVLVVDGGDPSGGI